MNTHRLAIRIVLSASLLEAVLTARATLPAPNDQLGTVPSGWFVMGDSNDKDLYDAPKHNVFVDTFQMDKNLITVDNWKTVYNWAVANGYGFSTNAGASFPGANQPVETVSWFDAAKWCNARSEMEGLTPCYYADVGRTTVYRSGNLNLATNNVAWNANGYRLPTEAEWEKAARGGLATNRFPWGMVISQSKACYQSPMVIGVTYDAGPASSAPTSTKPVGSYQPNGYGLYDMAGNLSEWCWDYYSGTYYTSGQTNNPQGATYGSRVARGGEWALLANLCRCACRQRFTATTANRYIGFRCVRAGSSAPPPAGQQSQTIYFDPSTPATLASGTTNPLVAWSSVGLPVTLAISTASLATLDGGNLAVGIGTITVSAHADAGTVNGTNYSAADTNRTFTVAPATASAAAVANTLSQFMATSTNVVDQSGLNAVLSHYWLQSPPCITNVTFPGRTSLGFTITNFNLTVQYSTNLSSWQNLGGPAKIVFDDTNALNAQNRYYRLVGSTNYSN